MSILSKPYRYVGMVTDKSYKLAKREECKTIKQHLINVIYDQEPMLSLISKDKFDYIDRGLLKDEEYFI